jgi:hypothetical protein
MAKSARCGACGSTLRAHKHGRARSDNAKTDRRGFPRPAAGRRVRKNISLRVVDFD